MSRKMKQKYWLKWLCALMLMVMCLFGRTQEAWAAGGTWNGCTWNWDGSTITVTSTTGGIPTVGRTSYPWYSYVSKATKIVVNVKGTIGDNAFYGCENATTIDLGSRVSSVGASAFYFLNTKADKITNLYVRYNGNINAGANAFFRRVCSGANLYVHCYPNNNTSANKSIYSGTSRLYIYHDLGTTGTWYNWDGIQWKFTGTTGSGTLYIQTRSGGDGTADATTAASGYPWYKLIENGKATTIEFHGAIIGQNAFRGSGRCCATTIRVDITGAIQANAFYGCSGATSIIVNATSIGDDAFYDCENATTIDLGPRVASVGASAFYFLNTKADKITNLYVRYNGNINAGANAFFRRVCSGANLYVHCWKKNTTSANKSIYSGTSRLYIKYFDDEGASAGCSHPFLSGWQTNASQHWRNCSQCGQKASTTVGNHAKAANYSQSGGTLYKNCTTCQYRMETRKITYYVQYNGNGSTGGSTAKSTHTYDTAKALTANGFTRTGYQWAHWNTKADNKGTSYSNKQSVNNLTTTNGGTVNLYAIWTANTYTVAYNINGGKGGSTAPSTHTYGVAKALTANGFTANDGFHFGSWNTQANGSGTKYTDKQSVTNLTATNKGTVTLYAQWDPNSFTVIFNGNGADAGSMSSQEFKYKETQALAANQFTRENYDFVGWSTNASATEADLEDGANGSALTTTNNGTVTLYAVWKLSVTTIVFHDQGGTGAPGEVVWLIGSVQHPYHRHGRAITLQGGTQRKMAPESNGQ